MESGELAKLRERCLYVDVSGSKLVWPEEQIAADLARLWTVVAGEVMAEVLGYADTEWERLVAAVEDFRVFVSHALEFHSSVQLRGLTQ